MTIIDDDTFHACALAAFVEIAQETGQNPPDCELTRQRAYAHYEALKRARQSEPKNVKDDA